MNITETKLSGVLLLQPSLFQDLRGGFMESYSQRRFSAAGLSFDWVQDNLSYSKKGVIRGLHYQLAPHAQAKLVHVLKGHIRDVVVDIRKGSPTFGQHISVDLYHDQVCQILIPRGFAHGFSVHSEDAIVLYKTDSFYHKESEAGILYNDVTLSVDWGISGEDAIVSDKDLVLPSFDQLRTNFTYTP